MASKFKSIFKKQMSSPSPLTIENTEESSAIMREMQTIPMDYLRDTGPIKTRNDEAEASITACTRNIKIRHRTSLGAIEDLLQCSVCMGRLKSPRMMPCQHTFCQDCLEKQLEYPGNKDKAIKCQLCHLTVVDTVPENLPTNLYIESLLRVMENPMESLAHLGSRNPVVSFAPLPDQTFVPSRSSSINADSHRPRCNKCETACGRDNRCKHCKQIFCGVCWVAHADELKEQLGNIVDQLETTANRFEHRIDEFRSKADELKSFIDKDIELRIVELKQEREERIKKAIEMTTRIEGSAEEIKQRIGKVQIEMQEQKDERYVMLADNHEKVKTFLSLHRKATDLMAMVATWKPDFSDDTNYEETKERSEVVKSKENIDLFYRSKSFAPKVVVDRDVVQRPSGLTLDPWREHIFVACPGTRQVVVLDKKYKLLRRIHYKDMMAPQGVVFLDNVEELFVTDKWKHCIYVFNRKGELVRSICTKGQGNTQLRCPEGIAVHPSKNLLYVADTGNDRIQILQPDGSFYGSIGPTERHMTTVTKSGKIVSVGVNHFNQPTDVAVSLTSVIVADCGNHKVKVFNHDNQLVHTIGGPGTLKGLFRSPEIVYVDSKGNIIVGDSGNSRIQIFSSYGELLRVLGGKGIKEGQFGWVSGLLVKENLDILVADSKNYTIQIF